MSRNLIKNTYYFLFVCIFAIDVCQRLDLAQREVQLGM